MRENLFCTGRAGCIKREAAAFLANRKEWVELDHTILYEYRQIVVCNSSLERYHSYFKEIVW